MALNKFFANWQSLEGALEDQHTALVFGFLRHAPTSVLAGWLRATLEAEIASVPNLEPQHFWPQFPSVVQGSQRTEPELVFDVESPDGPVTIVIENKRVDNAHTFEQVSREVIDSAHHYGSSRVALIMIGPDLGSPYDLTAWNSSLRQELDYYGLQHVEARLYYSSWAKLGRRIGQSAVDLDFGRYASDVLEQLSRAALMGYEGVPMLDDLEMTPTGAVKAFNRIVLTARQMFREITTIADFAALQLEPWAGSGYALNMDGSSRSLGQPAEWFEVSTISCLFRRESWRTRHGVIVALWLADDEAQLSAGAFACRSRSPTFEFASANPVTAATAAIRTDGYLTAAEAAELPDIAASDNATFRYATRPWMAETAEGDVPWIVARASDAVRLLQDAPKPSPPVKRKSFLGRQRSE